MRRNALTWILSSIGVVLVALTLFLVYPTGTMATCTVSVSCPNGGIIQCSGDHCDGTGNCATCTIHGHVTLESGCCQDQ